MLTLTNIRSNGKMAQAPAQNTQNGENKPRAGRGSRAPQGPRTIYVVLQIMGEDGQPMLFDKKRVKLLTIDSSADAMLSVAENDANTNAFFIRGKIARRTRGGPPGVQVGGPTQSVQSAAGSQRAA